jgi:amidohydrolase
VVLKSLFRVLFIVFSVLCSTLAAPAVDKKTAADIDREIEKIRGDMVKIRNFIHRNPELAYREQDTGKIIGSRLVSLGLDVKTGVAKTGVVALLRGGQPGATIAVRAEMDAMPVQEMADVPIKSLTPGVMHASGNDLHMAIVLGTAFVLNEFRAQLKGNVKFLFQPASEIPEAGEESGASLMIKEGVLENPTVGAIFGFHAWLENVGQVFVAPEAMLANADAFEITIKGKSPQGTPADEGVDAIVLAAQVVTALQAIISRGIDPMDPALLTIGRVEGGSKSDIIADRVRLQGIVRTLSDANRKKISRQIENAVKGIVHAFGGDYAFSLDEIAPAVYNHPELLSLLMPSFITAVGDKNVNSIKPQMMSDDFALFSQKVPALYFLLGVKNPRLPAAPLNSPYFNPDERCIATGIRVLCHLLLDALEQQSRLAKTVS